MSIKLYGAILVVAGCGGCGFAMAAAKRREERELRQLIRALEYMECELQYHETDLPQLCSMAAEVSGGGIGAYFQDLARSLERNQEPDVSGCVKQLLGQYANLSASVHGVLQSLGQSMGCFDLPGQLRGFQSTEKECRHLLDGLERDRDSRLRSYQTLGLCAGAALAIILL